jgi:hypothetical protein
MVTQFQKTLPKDIDTLWDIVKVYHPDIPEEAKGKVSTSLNYDWVCIEFRVKGYGYVAIGVDNCCQYALWGDRVSKADMIKALQDGTVTFRTWRFSTDKLFEKDIAKSLSPEHKQLENELSDKSIEILKSAGYKLQSPEEMYHIYYED